MRPNPVMTFMLLFPTFSWRFANSAANRANFNITIVTYGSPKTALVAGLPYTAPAYELGVEEIRATYGYKVRHILVQKENIVTCDDLEDYCYLVSQFYYRDWDQQSLFVLTLPEWNTLILSSGSAFPEARHDTIYPTAVSFSAINFAVWAKTFAEIFQQYHWTSITVIYDTWGHNSFYAQLADNLRHCLAPPKYTDVHLSFNPVDTSSGVTEDVRRAALLQARSSSRVILLAFRANETKRFMVTASDPAINMTNSEYVYFTAEPFRSAEFYGILRAANGDSEPEVARLAFRRLFQLTGTCSKLRNDGVNKLYEDIKRRSRMEYGIYYNDHEEPTEVTLASYYSIKTLGIVVDEILSLLPAQIYNGSLLARRFSNPGWSLDNQTVIGIDGYGDRVMDICVQSYNDAADSFNETVMYYDSSLTTLTINGQINWRTEGNHAPLNEPRCGYLGNNPVCAAPSGISVGLVAGIAVAAVLICILLSLFTVWRLRKEISLNDEWWKMHKDDLDTPETVIKPSGLSRNSAFSLSTMGKDPKHIRRLKGNAVWVTKIPICKNFVLNRPKRVALHEMKVISHGNLVQLIGIIVDPTYVQFVYEFCSKGSLNHLMDKMNIDWEFRAALLSDLLEGVTTIHSSVLRRHGYLSPLTCLIDKRFTMKISECGLYELTHDLVPLNQAPSHTATLAYSNVERWIAPEINRLKKDWSSVREVARVAGPEADIYAVGGIMATVMEDQGDVVPVDEGSHTSLVRVSDLERLIAACQLTNPNSRPGIEEVKRIFYQKTGVKTGGFLESLVKRMQKYAAKLEFAVKDRTDALNAERRLCEKLLVEMLPKPIVDMLRSGCAVQPEHFHGVTIFFSVIVGFVEFVASQSPLAVIDFLNHVFSSFDDVLPAYDVYKVETISDCYMVVSGLPTPNGNLHAAEVAKMSLHLLVVFRHIADELDMQIKIGLHSGSCAAGVVGSKRPRYCLFGDTVNTASRLASHGKPSKIHISTATSALVMHIPDIRVIERGVVELKGKGKERTFWLEEKAMTRVTS